MALRYVAQLSLGFHRSALHRETDGDAHGELRIAWIKSRGAAERRARIGGVLQGEMRLRQVGVESRVSRLRLGRLFEQGGGGSGISALQRDQSQQMQGVWMLGFQLKRLFIKQFRISQAPCTLVLQTPFDEIADH